MPKIPKKVVILGETYKVKFLTGLKDNEKVVGGLCDFHSQIIYLNPDASDTQLFVTFLHECCHVFLEITGMSQYMNKREVEMFCQTNAYFVMQFIRGFKK